MSDKDQAANAGTVSNSELIETLCHNRFLVVDMPDGSSWAVPVEIVARNRAANYSDEFDGDVERSLIEDTLPLFADSYEVEDWAANNMNWSDVSEFAKPVKPTAKPDYQAGWLNGEKRVLTLGA